MDRNIAVMEDIKHSGKERGKPTISKAQVKDTIAITKSGGQ